MGANRYDHKVVYSIINHVMAHIPHELSLFQGEGQNYDTQVWNIQLFQTCCRLYSNKFQFTKNRIVQNITNVKCETKETLLLFYVVNITIATELKIVSNDSERLAKFFNMGSWNDIHRCVFSNVINICRKSNF